MLALSPRAISGCRLRRDMHLLLLALFAISAMSSSRAAETLIPEQWRSLPLADAASAALAVMPPAGRWQLRIDEDFADVTVRVVDAQGALLAQLESIDDGRASMRWLVPASAATPLTLAIERRALLALDGGVRVALLRQSPPGPANAAEGLEARLSALPDDASDDEVDAALASALEAAGLWRAAGQPLAQARVLLTASGLAQRLRRHSDALAYATRAATLAEREDDTELQGAALNNAGLAGTNLRQFDDARASLTAAERLLAPTYADRAANPATGNLCFLSMRQRELDRAEQCFIRLLPVAAASGDLDQLRRIQNNLGGIYAMRGQPVQAIGFLDNALATATALGDQPNRARLLNNIASQYRLIGRTQEALAYYQQALGTYRDLGVQAQIARTLSNIGIAYGNLGLPAQAVRFLRDAYEIRAAEGGEVALLAKFNLAGALVRADEIDDAVPLLLEVIRDSDAADVPENGAAARIQLAIVYRRQGRPDDALALLADATETLRERVPSPRMLAAALRETGVIHAAQQSSAAALKALTEARQLSLDAGDPLAVANSDAAIGWAHWHAGRPQQALASATAAIDAIEALRTDIANPDMRASYQATLAEAYELAINCHATAPRGATAALEIAERYRAQTLVDVLGKSGAADAEIPLALKQRRDALRARINRAQINRLRNREAEDIAEVVAELNVLDGEIAKIDPRYRATDRRNALRAADMRRLLDERTVALQYFLGAERSFVWVITRQRIAAVELPPAAGIDALARELHETLARRGDHRASARKLGTLLLQPIAETLAGFDRIAIVADGSLHYVPFDVLTSAQSPTALVAGKALTYLPSLTTLALVRASADAPPRDRIAILADPVFSASDERLSASADADQVAATRGAGARLNRLVLSGEEARLIAALADDRELIVRTGLDANVAALQDPELRRSRILHIASHGFVDDEFPSRSGLALSMVDADGAPQPGFVGLRDIYELRLDADLVVLSACETALGRNLAGEGLLGLTRGFMYAGAERVVASLWPVEDRATAELMRHFYTALLERQQTPAEALAFAKAELQSERRLRHPYYWSGFVLLGDWRGLGGISTAAATVTGRERQ